MMIKKLFTVCCLLAIGVSAQAQEHYWQQNDASGFQKMEYIKMDIQKLIAENQSLEAQHKKLVQQYESLKMIEQQYRKQSGFSGYVPPTATLPSRQPQPLVGQVNMDERHQLLYLQLQDLELMRDELAMQLNLKKASDRAKTPEYAVEVPVLEDELLTLQKQHEGIIQATAREQQLSMLSPSQATSLEIDVKRMEEQVRRLEKKVDFQKRENTILRDKRDLALKSSEGILSEVREEQKMYQFNVTALEEQYGVLDQQVKIAAERQKKKQELVDRIISYDKENRVLTEKIDALNLKIKAIESDAIEASALAPVEVTNIPQTADSQ